MTESFKKIGKEMFNWEKKAKTAQKLHSKNHLLADEISKHFNEPKKFGMYLGVIGRIGFRNAYEIFAQIKQSKAKTPAKLFMWKVKGLAQNFKSAGRKNFGNQTLTPHQPHKKRRVKSKLSRQAIQSEKTTNNQKI